MGWIDAAIFVVIVFAVVCCIFYLIFDTEQRP